MMARDTELQDQIDALREDVQTLRKQLAAGVGVPDYRPFANGTALTISAGLPTWIAPSTYVGSVTAGAPLASTGGLNPIITHNTSGVSAGTFALATVTVNATGHITGISAGSAGILGLSATSPIVSSGGTSPTLSHATSGVAANTYAYPTSITVNAFGHVTALTAGSAPQALWGSIGGFISTQTDLQTALASKGTLAAANVWTGNQNVTGAITSQGSGAAINFVDRVNSAIWSYYATGGVAYFWNQTNGNVMSLSLAGALSVSSLVLPGSTSEYVRGNGSRATFPSFGSGTVTSVSAGVGMNFATINGSGAVTLGTPSTCTASTSNSASGTTHTHAITGFMSAAGGVFTGAITAPGVTDSSDVKFKDDIRTLRGGLDIVRALFPARFHNRLTDKQEVGFIAQDVLHVLPEIVTEDENGDLAVAYQRLTAPIVEALQQIDLRLRALESR